MISAWMSAVCEATDTPCGQGDRMVVQACVLEGVCANSRLELIRRQVADEGEEASVLFEKMHRSYVDAIRQGNVARFLRP